MGGWYNKIEKIGFSGIGKINDTTGDNQLDGVNE